MKRSAQIRWSRYSCLPAFSLIELTLAMGMMAMLALSLYGAMNVAFRARRDTVAIVESTRSAAIAADLIARDLQSVLPPNGILAGPFIGSHQPGVAGDNDSVAFCSIGRDEQAQPDDPLAEGIRRIELGIRTDVNPPVLVRRITRNLLPTVQPPFQEEILCRNCRSISLRYFDSSVSMWQEYWDSTTVGDVLPAAVAITIELADPAARPDAAPTRISRIIPLSCARPIGG